MALILFEGGLSLKLSELEGKRHSGRQPVTVGAVVTWGLTTLSAWAFIGLSIPTALLVGAILVVTGPTVVGAMLALAVYEATENALHERGKAATSPERSGTVQSMAGGVAYQSYRAADGTQRVTLRLPERSIDVVSERALQPSEIATLGSALAKCPQVSLNGVQELYVVEDVGMGFTQGQGASVGAVTDARRPSCVFVRRFLDTPWGRWMVLHEVGHLVDGEVAEHGAFQSVSAQALSCDGRPLFGHGRPLDKPRGVLSQDDYVDDYAMASRLEDMADMHALVLEQRTAFNQANPGHDLLRKSPLVAAAGLSPWPGQKPRASSCATNSSWTRCRWRCPDGAAESRGALTNRRSAPALPTESPSGVCRL